MAHEVRLAFLISRKARQVRQACTLSVSEWRILGFLLADYFAWSKKCDYFFVMIGYCDVIGTKPELPLPGR
jgi:hypothetical protein